MRDLITVVLIFLSGYTSVKYIRPYTDIIIAQESYNIRPIRR